MNPLRFKLLVVWNIVLSTAFLLLVLGVAVSTVQAANDPPIKVYTASLEHGSGIVGAGRISDVTINSTLYQTILSIPVNFTGQSHVHYCVAMGSANVMNPASGGSTGNRYDFSVKGDAAVSNFAMMTLEMSDNYGVDDPNYVPVSTQRVFDSLSAAPHTFYFVARKQAAGSPNMIVENASFTVICFKKLQTAAMAAPEVEEPQEFAPNDK
jgi:hypothetical protein